MNAGNKLMAVMAVLSLSLGGMIGLVLLDQSESVEGASIPDARLGVPYNTIIDPPSTGAWLDYVNVFYEGGEIWTSLPWLNVVDLSGPPSYGIVVSGTPDTIGTFNVKVSMGHIEFPGAFDDEFYVTLTVVGNDLSIASTPNNRAITGNTWSYTPTVSNGTSSATATISVSGVSWLTSNGTTISGTAPSVSGESQNFAATITAAKSGYTSATQNVTITVYAQNDWTTVPTPSMVITPLGNQTYRFDASGSEFYDTLLWDLGDGTTSTSLMFEHTFVSGAYGIELTAANNMGDASLTRDLLIVDGTTPTTASFGQQYNVTLDVAVGSDIPTVSGCPWLSVVDYGENYVTVQGTPSSIAYVHVTYYIVLTVGDEEIEWSVTVESGGNWPHAGFTVVTDGLTIRITSTAINADRTYYVFYEGGREILTNTAATAYTYASEGTYVIEQIVRTNVDGSEVIDTFSRTVTVTNATVDTGEDDNGNGGVNMSTLAIVIAGAMTAILAVYFIRDAVKYAPNRFSIFGRIVTVMIGLAAVVLLLLKWGVI